MKDNTPQDWTKFTADEPTLISPLTPPVPTITDWKAAFKDFALPIVNIQSAPTLPAPGAGLAGLGELLGKVGIFNDITGLYTTCFDGTLVGGKLKITFTTSYMTSL